MIYNYTRLIPRLLVIYLHNRKYILIHNIIIIILVFIGIIIHIDNLGICEPYDLLMPSCNKYTLTCLNTTLSHGYIKDSNDIKEWTNCIYNLRSLDEINKINFALLFVIIFSIKYIIYLSERMRINYINKINKINIINTEV